MRSKVNISVVGCHAEGEVGDVIVERTPGPVVKWAIDLLGTKDKPFLLLSVTGASLALGLEPRQALLVGFLYALFLLFFQGVGHAVQGPVPGDALEFPFSAPSGPPHGIFEPVGMMNASMKNARKMNASIRAVSTV